MPFQLCNFQCHFSFVALNAISPPAAKRRKNTAHGASRGYHPPLTNKLRRSERKTRYRLLYLPHDPMQHTPSYPKPMNCGRPSKNASDIFVALNAISAPAAKRRKNAAHGASRGSKNQRRKKPRRGERILLSDLCGISQRPLRLKASALPKSHAFPHLPFLVAINEYKKD